MRIIIFDYILGVSKKLSFIELSISRFISQPYRMPVQVLLLLRHAQGTPFVRHKICSYFQWEEQQQQQQQEDRQGRRPDLHGPLVRASLTCVSLIRASLIHVHTSWMHVPWIHASMTHVLWTHLRGSHGLSARRAQRTKSRRPEGPQTRSWGSESPLNF